MKLCEKKRLSKPPMIPIRVDNQQPSSEYTIIKKKIKRTIQFSECIIFCLPATTKLIIIQNC